MWINIPPWHRAGKEDTGETGMEREGPEEAALRSTVHYSKKAFKEDRGNPNKAPKTFRRGFITTHVGRRGEGGGGVVLYLKVRDQKRIHSAFHEWLHKQLTFHSNSIQSHLY